MNSSRIRCRVVIGLSPFAERMFRGLHVPHGTATPSAADWEGGPRGPFWRVVGPRCEGAGPPVQGAQGGERGGSCVAAALFHLGNPSPPPARANGTSVVVFGVLRQRAVLLRGLV